MQTRVKCSIRHVICQQEETWRVRRPMEDGLEYLHSVERAGTALVRWHWSAG